MNILFMGTPDFAVFSLKSLVESGENVIGVVTQPDKPKGRGYILTPSPVKVYALEHGIPVYQPNTLRGDEFAAALAEINPDLIVVVAFGKILPANVLDYPKLGCINVHGSLLPEYRGAAPMQRAIIDGKTQTGITTMYMDVGLDTGDMIMKDTVDIEENDNFENIHDKLGVCGANLILKTVEAIKNGSVTREKQDESKQTYAAKIEKEDCVIDFTKSVETIHNQIRGLSPMPLAITHLNGKLIKVITSRKSDCKKIGKPGEVVSLDGGVITVACADGCINLIRITPEGKKPMDSADFIRGRQISVGDILG